MPSLDMPLQELKKYYGVNPCPKDFDIYWERALAEMKIVDPEIKYIRSSFQSSFADCYDMYFTGVKGARIHSKLIIPKKRKKCSPAIIEFHGYTWNSGDWNDKLQYAAMGYTVAAMDCRGQGGLSEDIGGVKGNTQRGHIIRGLDDSPDNLLFRHIFLDSAQLAGIIIDMPEIDEKSVASMGYSQGGALSLACAALEPRIKKVVSVYPFLCDYKRVWDMDLTNNAYGDIQDYFKRFDPLHKREDEVFLALGYIDVQNLVKRIKGEVLMATSLLDETCPPSTQFAAYNKITSHKNIKIYPDYGHQGIPGLGDIIFEFLSVL